MWRGIVLAGLLRRCMSASSAGLIQSISCSLKEILRENNWWWRNFTRGRCPGSLIDSGHDGFRLLDCDRCAAMVAGSQIAFIGG
jgi:hypothetical protein